jgi:hypothetical protein
MDVILVKKKDIDAKYVRTPLEYLHFNLKKQKDVKIVKSSIIDNAFRTKVVHA